MSIVVVFVDVDIPIHPKLIRLASSVSVSPHSLGCSCPSPDEINDIFDCFDLLHLSFCVPLLFPRATLARRYPIHSNVETGSLKRGVCEVRGCGGSISIPTMRHTDCITTAWLFEYSKWITLGIAVCKK